MQHMQQYCYEPTDGRPPLSTTAVNNHNRYILWINFYKKEKNII